MLLVQDGGEEESDFTIDLRGIAHEVLNFDPRQLGIPPAQAMHCRPYRSLPHPQNPGSLRVRSAILIPGQEHLKFVEVIRLASSGMFRLQA